MDVFFTIAAPVPAEEPTVEEILVDNEHGDGTTHANCVVA